MAERGRVGSVIVSVNLKLISGAIPVTAVVGTVGVRETQ